jgi:hypothetical protein
MTKCYEERYLQEKLSLALFKENLAEFGQIYLTLLIIKLHFPHNALPQL